MLDKLRFFCDAEKDRIIVFDGKIQKVGCSFNLMYDIVCRMLKQRGLLLVGSRCRFCNIYKLRCNLAKKACKPFEVNSLHCSLLFSVNDSLSFLLFLSLLFLIELFPFPR